MDIFTRLKNDHDWQRELGDRIAMTLGPSATRRQLFNAFRLEVEAHAEAEEQTFYAALAEHLQGQCTVRDSLVDHEDGINLLAKLENLDIDNPKWMKTFLLLRQSWEMHINEEEAAFFDCARALLSESQIRHLTDLFDDRKIQEATRIRFAPALSAANSQQVLNSTVL
jgi:hypothetical protein